MPTPDEVARIKREALHELAERIEHQWDRPRGLTNRSLADAIRAAADEHYPAPRDCWCGHSETQHRIGIGSVGGAERSYCGACTCPQYAPDAVPKRVRAEVELKKTGLTAAWLGGRWVSLRIPREGHLTMLHREDIATLAALNARADAEGFVEEGLGTSTSERVKACDDGAGIAGLDTPQHGAALAPAPTPAALCECGHERGDHGPKMWGCAYCPCTAYEARPPESTDSFNSGEAQIADDAVTDAAGYAREAQALGDAPEAAQGLGQRDPNSDARSETKPSEPSPAPAPAPAETCGCGCMSSRDADGAECACDCHDPDSPNYRDLALVPSPAETREWRVMVDAKGWIMDGRALSASDARFDDAQYPQDAPHELLDVVPRAALDAMRVERDEERAIAAHWKSEWQKAWNDATELRAQRDEAQKERDDDLTLSEVYESAGIRTRDATNAHKALASDILRLRAQLREATGPVSRETFQRVWQACMDNWHMQPADIANAAITALGRSVEGP